MMPMGDPFSPIVMPGFWVVPSFGEPVLYDNISLELKVPSAPESKPRRHPLPRHLTSRGMSGRGMR
jgi:hypothetical protein